MGNTREKKTIADEVCRVHRSGGYAVLSNCFVRSVRIGCDAIGLLAKIMDLPSKWNFTIKGLAAICKDGETAIRSQLAELEEWGYAKKVLQLPNENPTGQFRYVYDFYEYSEMDDSVPKYDIEMETFTADNATLNRVKKDSNFTIVSGKLLRTTEIRNKLIGFMLKVLSLPNSWRFSMPGLTAICKEGKTAVYNAVNKLRDMGYLVRTKLLSNESIHNCFEYVYSFVREGGRADTAVSSAVEKQEVEKPYLDTPSTETPLAENQGQSNTKNKIQRNQLLSDKSSIIPSAPKSQVSNDQTVERKNDRYNAEEIEAYTEIIKHNIGYGHLGDWLCQDGRDGYKEADNIVGFIVDEICSPLPYTTLRGQSFPRSVVKSKLLQADIYTFFANGASPSGVLEHPGVIKNPERVREGWQRAYGGTRNAHRVCVLEEGMKYTPISIPNNEAQFLETRKGECVLLCGCSGCGKTTVTRLLNGLIPHYYEGELNGEVTVFGKNISDIAIENLAGIVGSVFQNPRSQFFCVDTAVGIAFGCENMGLPETEIQRRIDHTITNMKIQKLMGRSIFNLSGGEKQKIACAGVSAMLPELIVLDEPTSNLDLDAIDELRSIIAKWKIQGKTIVIAEHRLGWLNGLCDRVLFMENGSIGAEFSGSEFFSLNTNKLNRMGLRAIQSENNYLESKTGLFQINDHNSSKDMITLENFKYSYGKKDVLGIEHLELPKGALIAVVGHNGAGKSTFTKCLCGMQKKFKGKVIIEGKTYHSKDMIRLSYMVMQDVNHQLFAESVIEEVMLGADDSEKEKAMEILEKLNISEYKDRHPMSLSGGQKQRVTIASALLTGKQLLVFDEPTSGLDFRSMERTAELLKSLENDITVLIVTHDMELIDRCCTHILHIEN